MFKSLRLIIAHLIIVLPAGMCAMNPNPPLPQFNRYAVVFLTNTTTAIGNDTGCHLITHSKISGNIITSRELYAQPTYNLITNHNRQKLGLVCPDFFVAYDVVTKKKIWTYPISHKENYAATFSTADDTIFLCHNSTLISNNHKSVDLQLAETNNLFGITCYPGQKQIVYVSNNRTVTLQSLEPNGPITRHATGIGYDRQLCSALYSPYNPRIMALRTRKKLFISNFETKNTHEVRLEKCCEIFDGICCDLTFLPHSSIIAIICNGCALHFWDFIAEKTISLVEFFCPPITNMFTKICDFSPDSRHYAAIIHNTYYRGDTPVEVIYAVEKNIKPIFAYWLLKHYSSAHNNFILPEIIELLTHNLIATYKC